MYTLADERTNANRKSFKVRQKIQKHIISQHRLSAFKARDNCFFKLFKTLSLTHFKQVNEIQKTIKRRIQKATKPHGITKVKTYFLTSLNIHNY